MRKSSSRSLPRKPIRLLTRVIGTTLATAAMKSTFRASYRLVHAAGGDLGDLGLEGGHALGDQLGEDRFSMDLVVGGSAVAST